MNFKISFLGLIFVGLFVACGGSLSTAPCESGGVGGMGGATSTSSSTGGSSSDPGELEVAISPNTPSDSVVLQNAQKVEMIEIDLSAQGNQNVQNARFTRVGDGFEKDIAGVEARNGATLLVTCAYDPVQGVADCNGLNLSVANNTMSHLGLFVTLAHAGQGGHHSWQVAKASDVTLASPGVVMGSFPVKGNVFTVGNQ